MLRDTVGRTESKVPLDLQTVKLPGADSLGLARDLEIVFAVRYEQ